MECPYCGAELECIDWYGRYLGTEWEVKFGDIYKCLNTEGFQNEEDAENYILENHIENETVDNVTCESSVFNGFFYTDNQENLYEGYPC